MKKILLLLLLISPALLAQGGTFYKIGDLLPAWELQDQFEKKKTLGDEVRMILFSRDMDFKDLIHSMLIDEGERFLEEHETLYIADIHEMPSLITKLFALPKMREYPYRLFLDRDGEITKNLPTREGKVSLIRLERRKIISIQYLSDMDQIKGEIRKEGLP